MSSFIRHLISFPILTAVAIAQEAPGTPVVEEFGWILSRAVSVPDPMSAKIHPFDGALYVLRRANSAEDGLYRIEADDTLTLLASLDEPADVVVDPADGDLFVCRDTSSAAIYRTAFGGTGAATWVSGFASGDDDPIGMAIVPMDHAGPVLDPGAALVVNFGYQPTSSHSPPSVWVWSPGTAEGEVCILDDPPGVTYFSDCAIGCDRVWLLDHDWTLGSGDGGIFELVAVQQIAPLATSEALNDPVAIVVDPVTGDLLVKESTSDRVVRVDPATGTVSTVISGFGFLDTVEWAGLDITPDGRTLIVTDHGQNTVWVFDKSECVPFCSALPNATGTPAELTCSGDPGSSLVLSSSPVPNTTGQFFFGPMMLAGSAFGDGLLCVGGMTQRVLPLVNAGMMAQAPNTASLAIDYAAPYSAGLTGIKHFQYWFRSGLTTGSGFNTSGGISVAF